MPLSLSPNALNREYVKSDYILDEFPDYVFHVNYNRMEYVVVERGLNEQKRHNVIIRSNFHKKHHEWNHITSGDRKDVANVVKSLINLDEMIKHSLP